jgi:GAF domain-containing protein
VEEGAADERELESEVARELAQALMTDRAPLELYRLALARVTPLVGASFASVFLRDPDDPRLLRLACAQNWPQASARFLSDLRIREGRGPTGRAVSEGASVEVEDVFGDPDLSDWWEPARELGFVSMTAHPLAAEDRVFGALSFYFAERQQFDDRARTLLRIVAHQLAATAERAHLVVDVRSPLTPDRDAPGTGSR